VKALEKALQDDLFVISGLGSVISLLMTIATLINVGGGQFKMSPQKTPIQSSASNVSSFSQTTAPVPQGPSTLPDTDQLLGSNSAVISGDGASRLIQPKKPGEWIVDAQNASDADSNVLSDVIASAGKNDVIHIRPGTYQGELDILNDIEIRGTDLNNPPIIKTSGNHLFNVQNKTIKLYNLELQSESIIMSSAILRLNSSEAHLQKVQFKTTSNADYADNIWARKSKIFSEEIKLLGADTSIAIDGQSELQIKNSEISNAEGIGISVFGPNNIVNLQKMIISNVRSALHVHGQMSKITASTLKIENTYGTAITIRGLNTTAKFENLEINTSEVAGIHTTQSEIEISHSTFIKAGSTSAIRLIENSKATLDNVVISQSQGDALRVDGSEIRIQNSKMLEVKRSCLDLENAVIKIDGLNCSDSNHGLQLDRAIRGFIKNSIFEARSKEVFKVFSKTAIDIDYTNNTPLLAPKLK